MTTQVQGVTAPTPSYSSSVSARPGAASSMAPCVRLFEDVLLINGNTPSSPAFFEVKTVLLGLSFDPADEKQTRFVIENLGAVDLSCLDDVHVMPGSRADYAICLDGDANKICAFSAYVVPQLRKMGWRVEIAPGFPYDVVPGDSAWYAHVHEGESSDWLGLELGIEFGGCRINLLPALLEMLADAAPKASIASLMPSTRCLALPVQDGRFVAVPVERLRILLDVLRELYDDDSLTRGKPLFSAARAAALARLESGFSGPGLDGRCGGLRFSGATRVVDKGRAIASAADVPPQAVGASPGLRATLRPYQEQGVRWLQILGAQQTGGVLADDMGLGKTLQTIAHIVAEKAAGRLHGPALVVAPTSLLPNWRSELKRFAPHLRVMDLYGPGRKRLWPVLRMADVVLTTYTVLTRDRDQLDDRVFPLLVLDEAQAIKNVRSQMHQAVSAVIARQRVCLTGTPLENNLMELWALFDLMVPGLLGEEDSFRHRYAVPIEREGNAECLAALRRQVAPYILRRTKEQVVPELPPKTEIVRPVELRGKQRDLYESLRVAAHADVRRVIQKKGLGASTVTILSALMKLRQLCCDPRLLPGEVAREVPESAKTEMFFEILGQQLERGRRVLVFSQFTSMLSLLGQGLRQRGINYNLLTGSTPDRSKPVEAFERGETNVFLISLKAGGTGLNLTSADTVIHYDPWWNPAAQAQATDRAYRIGQKKPVFVFKLIVAGSVEEHMMRLQEKKRALADGVFGVGPTGGARFSTDDLDDLFSPIDAAD